MYAKMGFKQNAKEKIYHDSLWSDDWQRFLCFIFASEPERSVHPKSQGRAFC